METAAPTTQTAPEETTLENEATGGGDESTDQEVSSDLSLEARLQKADQLLAA